MTTIDQLFGARTAVTVPDAIARELAGVLRARFEHAGYARYALVDRGSYDIVADPDLADVAPRLVQLAAAHAGGPLAIAESRVLRLSAGDYLLAHHDRIHDDLPIEVTLDLSSAAVPGADVHYRRRGQVFFRFPSAPGAMSIVERGPAVTCNHTYVSKLHANASIVRLVLLLRSDRGASRA
jgi:hypothetical protein